MRWTYDELQQLDEDIYEVLSEEAGKYYKALADRK